MNRAHIAAPGLSAGDTPANTASRVRQPLSAALVVQTAVNWVEDFDLETLSMRRLGQALGVEAMSLYRYVPSREQLLDAMVELLVSEVVTEPAAGEPSPEVRGDWEDYVRRLACGLRQVALKYPHTFPMLAYRPLQAPWMRPPIRSLEWTEALFAALSDAGFSDAAAVSAYQAFGSFLLGQLGRGSARAAAQAASPPVCAPAVHPSALMGLERFPHVARMHPTLVEDHDDEEFEQSLADLFVRIALLRR